MVLFDTVMVGGTGGHSPAPLAPFRMMRGWKSGASLPSSKDRRGTKSKPVDIASSGKTMVGFCEILVNMKG